MKKTKNLKKRAARKLFCVAKILLAYQKTFLRSKNFVSVALRIS